LSRNLAPTVILEVKWTVTALMSMLLKQGGVHIARAIASDGFPRILESHESHEIKKRNFPGLESHGK